MTYAEARWGLLLIAEEGYGKASRMERAEEDATVRQSRALLGG